MHNWPFAWGIHQLLGDSQQYGQVRQSFDGFVVVSLNKQLSGQWNELPLVANGNVAYW